MSDNLFSYFRKSFPADLSAPFLTYRDRDKLTYAELLDRTGQLANLFVSRGVMPGDRIAVQVDKSPTALLVYLAALRAGAVYLPLNPAYTEAELRYFLGDASPVLFICRPDDAAALRELATDLDVPVVETLGADGRGTLADAVGTAPTEFIDVRRGQNDIAAILYTSGTTGRSKGAMLSHGNLASNADALHQIWQFSPEDILLHALPIFHTHGLFVATNVTLRAGSSMLFLPNFDAHEVAELLPETTVLMGVPTFYTRLLARPELCANRLGNMRLFVSGSAPLSAETHREFECRTGHRILERYGMTETNMNSSNPYEGARVAGSVGLPLPGVEIRVVDPATSQLPAGQIGAVEIRGPNVFSGYWRMPEKTAAEFRDDGFFVTGDLGYFDEKGYLFLAGRAKDLIISGGFNVYPAEVEEVIETVAGIGECAVIGVPHSDLGEAVIAIVTPMNGASPSLFDIQPALDEQLARYKHPRQLFIIPELPRNAMGKVEKKKLRETYAGAFAP